jgi:hypothetical protein
MHTTMDRKLGEIQQIIVSRPRAQLLIRASTESLRHVDGAGVNGQA